MSCQGTGTNDPRNRLVVGAMEISPTGVPFWGNGGHHMSLRCLEGIQEVAKRPTGRERERHSSSHASRENARQPFRPTGKVQPRETKVSFMSAFWNLFGESRPNLRQAEEFKRMVERVESKSQQVIQHQTNGSAVELVPKKP